MSYTIDLMDKDNPRILMGQLQTPYKTSPPIIVCHTPKSSAKITVSTD